MNAIRRHAAVLATLSLTVSGCLSGRDGSGLMGPGSEPVRSAEGPAGETSTPEFHHAPFDPTEIEPNDFKFSASRLLPGKTVRGEVGIDGDTIDWYAFQPLVNGRLQIQIANTHPAGTPLGQIRCLKLYRFGDPDTNAWMVSQGSSSGCAMHPGWERSLQWVSVSAGETYVVAIEPKYVDHAAPYEITAFFEGDPRRDLGEPNEIKATAWPILDNETIRASIGYWKNGERDELDWYSFLAPTNGRLSVRVENLIPEMPGQLRALIDCHEIHLWSDNTRIQRLGNSSGCAVHPGQEGTTSYLSVTAGEIYYIRINPEGRFDSALYEVTAVFEQESTPDRREPNDDSNSPAQLSVNQPLSALTGYGIGEDQDEHDWYQVTVPADGNLVAWVRNDHPDDVTVERGKIGCIEIWKDGVRVRRLGNSSGCGIGWNQIAQTSALPVVAGETYEIHVFPFARSGPTLKDSAPYTLAALLE